MKNETIMADLSSRHRLILNFRGLRPFTRGRNKIKSGSLFLMRQVLIS